MFIHKINRRIVLWQTYFISILLCRLLTYSPFLFVLSVQYHNPDFSGVSEGNICLSSQSSYAQAHWSPAGKMSKVCLFKREKEWMRQGCCMSATLFSIYINELATILENQQLLVSLYQMTWFCCSYKTGLTAEPGPARAQLPDLGPGSKHEKDKKGEHI